MGSETLDRPGMEDTNEFASNMAVVLQRSQEIMAQMAEAQAKDDHPLHADPLNVLPVFKELTEEVMKNPAEMWEASMTLWTNLEC